MRDLRPVANSILNSYSGVLFFSRPAGGLAILLFTLVLNPNLGLSALVCLLSAYLCARLLGLKEDFLRLDFYIYNPLLVGLSIGYFFRLDLLSLLFLVLMGVFTFFLTYGLSSAFSYYLRLPVLSLPFVIGSLIATLASYHYSNLFVKALYARKLFLFTSLPLWLDGFLRALGAVFFMPHPLVGLGLFLVLLLASRILAFLALAGYLAGSLLVYLFTGSSAEAFSNLAHFNFILIAMALGGVFLIPSPRSYLLALIASAMAVPLTEASRAFWERFGLPAFALPFNLTTLLVLYALGVSGYRRLTGYYRGTPESTLDHYLTWEKRFPSTAWEVELPVSGRWTVWQGPDGQFTHKGPWRYALDFVITDEEGRTHGGDGTRLEDYYAYRKPVLSPVSGRVVEVVDGLPDEPPGSANREQPWGNYVVIHDQRGFYAVLAHLSPGTVKVKKGDWVVKGALVGLCGSSGYSPEPHLHLHLQTGPELGSPTIPFLFSGYLRNGEFHALSLPAEGETVEPALPEKRLKQSLNLLLGQKFTYEVQGEEGSEEILHLEVKMAPDGTFYLTDGKARLYFAQRGAAFCFLNYEGTNRSPLRWFFLAAPRIPLNLRPGISWSDHLPLEILLPPLKKGLYLFLISFWPSFLRLEARYQALGRFDFRGRIIFNDYEVETAVKIHPLAGFEEVVIRRKGRTLRLRRRENDEENA
ncbi:urea transporter [Thermosulfurimonas sp. F29]|uniref:urea transporter n=1 Tax=Thermosulfurimonas sp. F29 TaxID=2867247 RepID=UPI001C831750|nr:urea transporter [Thermosulfurimonas sp. F29]MBX6423285.1 urea transporter [Thermosulfurimonas sp. F29]